MKNCPKCKSRVSTVPTFDGSYLAACENPSCDYERSFGPTYDHRKHLNDFRHMTPAEIEMEESR